MPTTLETALPTAAAAAPSVVALLPSPCAGWGPVYSAHWRQTDFGGLQQMYATHKIVSFKQNNKVFAQVIAKHHLDYNTKLSQLYESFFSPIPHFLVPVWDNFLSFNYCKTFEAILQHWYFYIIFFGTVPIWICEQGILFSTR